MTSLLYIFNGRWPTEKAHGIQIAKMCEAYSRAGIDVTLVAPYQRGVKSLDPFQFYGLKNHFKIRRTYGMDPAWLWNISQSLGHMVRVFSSMIGAAFYLLFKKADIYYARDYASIILLALLGFHPIVEIHDYRLKNRNFVLSWALSRARAVICNSEGTKSLLAIHYPLCTNVFVVPNGVDPNFFDIPETKEEARVKLNLPQDKIIIGYVGRFEIAGADKGIFVLKEAFQKMKYRDKAELLLVGGPELSVPYAQVPLYLRAIDIAVIPFPGIQHAKTTSPIKLFEYQAARKAIVIADSPDPQNLADKLDEALKHPQATYAGELYTWDSRARKILDFINENP